MRPGLWSVVVVAVQHQASFGHQQEAYGSCSPRGVRSSYQGQLGSAVSEFPIFCGNHSACGLLNLSKMPHLCLEQYVPVLYSTSCPGNWGSLSCSFLWNSKNESSPYVRKSFLWCGVTASHHKDSQLCSGFQETCIHPLSHFALGGSC